MEGRVSQFLTIATERSLPPHQPDKYAPFHRTPPFGAIAVSTNF